MIAILGCLMFGNVVSGIRIFRVSLLSCVLFYLMPMMARGYGIFFPGKNIWLYWFLFVGIGIILSLLWNKSRSVINVFLFLISLALVYNGAKNFLANSEDFKGASVNESKESYSYLDGHKIVCPYNVYVLIYDGWPNDCVGNYYGVPNPFPKLEKRGFTTYPKAYTPLAYTLGSMHKFFDIFNDTYLSPRDIMVGRAKCLRFLRANNYKTHYVLSEYHIKNSFLLLEGDVYFPRPEMRDKIVIEKVLLRCILNGWLSQTTEDFESFSHNEAVNAKRNILSEKCDRPKFLYSHSGPRHTPVAGEYRGTEEEEQKAFIIRANTAMEEMMMDIKSVGDQDNSIIIIASDHGAFLNIYENAEGERRFLDQNASMLAVRWPKGYEPTMDVSFIPNVMLEVMICLTGDKSLGKHKQAGYILPISQKDKYPFAEKFKDGKVVEENETARDIFDVAKEIFTRH